MVFFFINPCRNQGNKESIGCRLGNPGTEIQFLYSLKLVKSSDYGGRTIRGNDREGTYRYYRKILQRDKEGGNEGILNISCAFSLTRKFL